MAVNGIYSVRLLLAALTVLFAVDRDLCAQEDESQPPLLYRRINVPADRIGDFPRSIPYAPPMDVEEFERRVRAVELAEQLAREPAVVLSGLYDAQFDGKKILTGEATLRLRTPPKKFVRLPLDDSSLAVISAPRISGEDLVHSAEGPPVADLGLDASGRLAAVVSGGAETMTFRWRLRGEFREDGSTRFRIALPTATISQFRLRLPAMIRPTVSRGIVRQLPPAESSDDEDSERLWQLDVDATDPFDLVLSEMSAGTLPRQPLVKERLHYKLAEDRLLVAAEMLVEVDDQRLDTIRLSMNDSLHVMFVECEFGQCEFQLEENNTEGFVGLSVKAPRPFDQGKHTLKIQAVGPLELGTVLIAPRLTMLDAIWQGSDVRVSWPRGLALEQLETSRCRQTSIRFAESVDERSVAEFTYLSPDAEIRLAADLMSARLAARSGEVVTIATDQAESESTFRFSAAQGSCFELSGAVGEGWEVDSVECQTDGVLADWWIEEPAHGGRPETSQRQLIVRLARPIHGKNKLELVIRGHRSLDAGIDRVRAADLKLVQFDNVYVSRRIVAVVPPPLTQVRTHGDVEVDSLDSVDKKDHHADLLSSVPRGSYAYIDGPECDQLAFSFAIEPAKFSADLLVSTNVQQQSVVETFVADCDFESGLPRRIRIAFSSPGDEPIVFRRVFESGKTEILDAKKIDPANDSDDTEVWEISLRSTNGDRSESLRDDDARELRIHGERKRPYRDRFPVSLFSLTEATSQEGEVRIVSPSMIVIENQGLRQTRADALDESQHGAIRGQFRYEPARYPSLASAPGIFLTQSTADGPLAAAWAWRCDVETRLTGGGAVGNCATFFIENNGRESVELNPRVGSRLLRVVVSGRQSPSDVPAVDESPLVVPLPVGVRFPIIVVHYETDNPGLHIVSQFEPNPPQLNIPVLQRHWRLWCPSGFEIVDAQSGHTAKRPFRQRLFGLFSGVGGDEPFQLFNGASWTKLVGMSPEISQSEVNADKCLTEITKMIGQLPADNRTWRNLLVGYRIAIQDDDSTAPPILLVDQPALFEAGITPETPLPTGSSDQTAAELIDTAGLAIVGHTNVVLLTTRVKLAELTEQVAPGDRHPAVYYALPGPLRDQLDASLERASEFFLVVAWSAQPGEGSPWLSSLAVSSPSTSRSWRLYRSEIPDNGEIQVRVYRPAAMKALGWASLLGALSIALWLGGTRISVWLITIGIVGVAALVIPIAFTPIGSGVFLGVTLAGVFRLLRPKPKRAVAALTHEEPGSTSRARAMTAVTFIWLTFGFVAATRGQGAPSADETPATAAKQPTIHKVLVPVDDKRKPTGKLYLPQEFYDSLHRRAAAVSAAPTAWVLRSANYEGDIERSPEGEGYEVANLKVAFDVRVFARGKHIRISLPRLAVEDDEQAASLNGLPVELKWDDDDNSFRVFVAEPGVHRVEVSLQPRVDMLDGRSGFEFSVPSVPIAKLELALPAKLRTVSVPSATGSVRTVAEDGLLSAELGFASTLAVWWSDQSPRDGKAIKASVDQLTRMRIDPGSVAVKSRFQVTVTQGEMRELQLMVAPSLRLADNAVDWRIVRDDDDGQLLAVAFDEPLNGDTVVDVNFSMARSGGLGDVRVPAIDLVQFGPKVKLLALHIDPALQFDLPITDDVASIDTADFQTAWREDAEVPVAAYRISPDAEAAPVVTTEPLQSDTFVEELSTLHVGASDAQFEYRGVVETTDYRFRYELAIPAQLEVRSVSLVAESVERASMWSVNDRGELSVVLDGPVRGMQTLTVRGELPVSLTEEMALPQVRLTAAEIKSSRLKLYARNSVVIVPGEMTFVEQDPDVGSSNGHAGHLVAAWQLTPGKSDGRFMVVANRLDVVGTMATVVGRQAGKWWAESDLRFRVQSGRVDALQFNVPQNWGQDIRLTPDLPHEVVSTAEGGQRLIVQPASVVDGEFRLRITSPLLRDSSNQLLVPEITPLDLSGIKRLVILPTRSAQQDIEWEIQGLENTPIPADFTRDLNLPESFAAYHVAGPRYSALLKSISRDSQLPCIQNRDVSVRWLGDETYFGVATFDVNPAGRSQCTLEIPESSELIHARVAGLAGQVKRLSADQQWQLMLGHSRLPQRIEIVYRGRLDQPTGSDGGLQVSAPVLREFDIDQTLWTVQSPIEAGGAELADPDAAIDPLRQEISRFRSKIKLTDLPDDVLTQLAFGDVDELRRWIEPWLERMESSRGEISVLQLLPGRDPRFRAIDVERLDDQRMEMVRRLGTRQRDVESDAVQMREVFHSATHDGVSTVYASTAGKSPEIAIRYQPQRSGSRWLLPFAIVAFVLALAGLWCGFRYGNLAEWLAGWPHIVAVLVGICWWLWLSPSIVGLIIVAIAALHSLRSAWTGQSALTAMSPRTGGRSTLQKRPR